MLGVSKCRINLKILNMNFIVKSFSTHFYLIQKEYVSEIDANIIKISNVRKKNKLNYIWSFNL